MLVIRLTGSITTFLRRCDGTALAQLSNSISASAPASACKAKTPGAPERAFWYVDLGAEYFVTHVRITGASSRAYSRYLRVQVSPSLARGPGAQAVPSVREVLVDVMKMQPGRKPDAPAPSVDDVRREDAVRAIGAALQLRHAAQLLLKHPGAGKGGGRSASSAAPRCGRRGTTAISTATEEEQLMKRGEGVATKAAVAVAVVATAAAATTMMGLLRAKSKSSCNARALGTCRMM